MRRGRMRAGGYVDGYSVRAPAECRPGCGAMIKTKGRSPAREVGKERPAGRHFKGGAGHRWRDGRPLDHNTGTGPRVAIVARNIIELALDFHGSDAQVHPRHGTG